MSDPLRRSVDVLPCLLWGGELRGLGIELSQGERAYRPDRTDTQITGKRSLKFVRATLQRDWFEGSDYW